MAPEESNIDLENLIRQLPLHKAPEGLWNKIETELWYLDEIDVQLSKLPSHTCPKNVWGSIARGLSVERGKHKIKIIAGIAASVLIVWSFAFNLYEHLQRNKYTISYTEENMQKNITSESSDLRSEPELITQEAMNMIRDFCSQQQTVCKDPALQEMLDQLENVNAEFKQLSIIYPSYVDEREYPELIKIKVKLENTRDEILKKIMNMISV